MCFSIWNTIYIINAKQNSQQSKVLCLAEEQLASFKKYTYSIGDPKI